MPGKATGFCTSHAFCCQQIASKHLTDVLRAIHTKLKSSHTARYLNLSMTFAAIFTRRVTRPSNGDSLMKSGSRCRAVTQNMPSE